MICLWSFTTHIVISLRFQVYINFMAESSFKAARIRIFVRYQKKEGKVALGQIILILKLWLNF